MFNFEKVYLKINKESLLKSINLIDAFSYYFGEQISLKKKYQNPLRLDKSPGCKFIYTKDSLVFADYAKSKSYDLIEFVKEKYNLNFMQTLNKIKDDLNLNLSQNIDLANDNKSNTLFTEKKEKTLIQITEKPFNSLALKYWSDYLVTLDELKKENIFFIDKLWINKKICKVSELAFAYYYPEIDGFKIYQPFNKDYKWFNNIPFSYIDGLNELPKIADDVILGSSKKDKIIIKKIFTDVCSVQGESKFAISSESNYFFDQNYKRKWCFFDCDNPGKEANKSLNDKNYLWINIENNLYEKYNIKDPGDYVLKFKELSYLQNLIKKNYADFHLWYFKTRKK